MCIWPCAVRGDSIDAVLACPSCDGVRCLLFPTEWGSHPRSNFENHKETFKTGIVQFLSTSRSLVNCLKIEQLRNPCNIAVSKTLCQI